VLPVGRNIYKGVVADQLDDDTVMVLSPDHFFVDVKTNGRKYNVGDQIYYIGKNVNRKRIFIVFQTEKNGNQKREGKES
jgi:hypothetical protein